ncbi:MAG TPA: hypothetical protein VM324_04565 [Egibacteraceae bacterium]|jgi:hypothetical protein|nr:hypothetical protein [Egibacteraceae bacterium]
MQPDPSIDTPLFIPDHLQDVYQEDAALQVRTTRAAAPAPARPRSAHSAVAVSSSAARTQRAFVLLAAVLALVGGAVCTAWWAWLAHDTGSTLWNNFAVGGGVAVVLGVVTCVGYWLSRP